MTTSILLNVLIVVQLNGKTHTSVDHCNGDLPNLTHSFRTWSESGVVKLKTNFTPKLEKRGEVNIFLGHVEKQNYGVY